MTKLSGFLLTREYRDTPDGMILGFWFKTDDEPVYIEVDRQEAVLFVLQSDVSLLSELFSSGIFRVGDKLFLNYENNPVLPVYFLQYSSLRDCADRLAKKNIPHWEADIRPADRYLMERFITAGATISYQQDTQYPSGVKIVNPSFQSSSYKTKLDVVSIDIETSMDAKQLYSIACYAEDTRCVWMVGDPTVHSERAVYLSSEKEVLGAFLTWVSDADPDILIGWNVVQFDFWILETLCQKNRIVFNLGRQGQRVRWREDNVNQRRYMTIPGRIALDGIDVLKMAGYNFPSYSLQNVSESVLDTGKILSTKDRGQEITQLFHHDKEYLAKYNLKDCILVWDIFKKLKLLDFVVARSQLTGLPLDRTGGSVASFEYAYLPLLHRKGYVAPNLGDVDSELSSPGGYVLSSEPGIYKNILVFDFKSLYPSIIRTFLIDPYSFWYAQRESIQTQDPSDCIQGFHDAIFSKKENILPGIIERLWLARDEAKCENDQPLSHAIKIIMNSFYGVLGSQGCRFYDPRVCSSITLRGHEILQQTKAWIESLNHTVIYGDTDSVFVWVGDELTKEDALSTAKELSLILNERWQEKIQHDLGVSCALELEFETHFLKFIMPTIRNSSQGSKKRYAGLIENAGRQEIIFKGLENVRTDWTPLAKQFQANLYRRVFDDEPVESFIREMLDKLCSGVFDSELLYRKRLRRHLSEYIKVTPPHVQAGRKLTERTGEVLTRGDWVEYVITREGPEPTRACMHRLDYQHYIDRQLKPVADGILHFIGLRFDDIVHPQLSLFSE